MHARTFSAGKIKQLLFRRAKLASGMPIFSAYRWYACDVIRTVKPDKPVAQEFSPSELISSHWLY